MKIKPSHLKAYIYKISPVKFFVLTSFVFGIIFMLITPPFQTPDEPVHFYRAYQISQGALSVQKYGQIAGGELPVSLRQTVNFVYTPDVRGQPSLKYGIKKTKQAFAIKENPQAKEVYDISATAYYSAVSYVPQAAGILASRIVHASPIAMMYLARFMVLVTWITLLALAISAMPKKKWALTALALLPMVIFQATSLSADVVGYGLLALFFALTVKYTSEEFTIDFRRTVYLSLLLTLTVLSKQLMFVFVLLVFLLPEANFKSKKDRLGKIGIMIVTSLSIFGLWMLYVKGINISSTSIFHPVPGEQIRSIIFDPISYAYVIFRTYFLSYGDGIARSFIGDFGWLDTPLAEFFASLGYVTLAFLYIASYESSRKWLSKKAKTIIVVIGSLYFIGVTTAIYVFYDPVKYISVIGLQGRYFIPLAIIFIPLLYGTWLRTSEKSYRKVAIIAPILLLTVSAITIIFRFYIAA